MSDDRAALQGRALEAVRLAAAYEAEMRPFEGRK